jgi:hypothetical protein
VIFFFSILITIFISYNNPDYSSNLRKFIGYEDSRNLNQILNSYAFPVKKYWNHENLSKNELEKSYKKAWKIIQHSKNQIIELKKVDNFNFVLTTQFKYKLKNRNNESTVESKLKFKLNGDGKIVSLENINYEKIANSKFIAQSGSESENHQLINSFTNRYKYSLIIILCIIIFNVWWFISARNLMRIQKQLDKEKELKKLELNKAKKLELIKEKELKKLELIKEKKLKFIKEEELKNLELIKEDGQLKKLELIAKKSNPSIFENKNDKIIQKLMKKSAERLAEFSKEKDIDIPKLTEKIKELNKGVSNANIEKEIKRLGELILKAKFAKKIVETNKSLTEFYEKNKIKRANEIKRLAKIERNKENQRLADIERANEIKRLAKIERSKENQRLADIERANEIKRLARVKEEKRLAAIERANEIKRLARVARIKEEKRLAEIEKERIEKENVVKNTTKKPHKIDLSQYMGQIDEDIIEDEERENNFLKNNLNKYFTDLD